MYNNKTRVMTTTIIITATTTTIKARGKNNVTLKSTKQIITSQLPSSSDIFIRNKYLKGDLQKKKERNKTTQPE